MRCWLAENPQHKHGVHRYSLEQLGLDLGDGQSPVSPDYREWIRSSGDSRKIRRLRGTAEENGTGSRPAPHLLAYADDPGSRVPVPIFRAVTGGLGGNGDRHLRYAPEPVPVSARAPES